MGRIDDERHAGRRGFNDILETSKRKPDILITDEDPGVETRGFKELCAMNEMNHQFRVGRNDIAAVDRLIYTIKRACARHMAGSGVHDWAAQLQQVIKGHNESGHPHLMGSAPEDVLGTDVFAV